MYIAAPIFQVLKRIMQARQAGLLVRGLTKNGPMHSLLRLVLPPHFFLESNISESSPLP
jgi:hypothetical protein